jgi:hypothetical protein
MRPLPTPISSVNARRARPGRRIAVGLAIVVAVAALLVGGFELTVGSPRIPAGAAASPLATVKNATAGEFPDPTGDTPYDREPLVRRACLDSVVRPGGSLALCWTVGRLMTENDSAHDTYILRVIGTLHGDAAPSGVRWAVIRAVPDAASSDYRIVDTWPGSAVFDGGCRDVPMAMGLLGPETDPVCGRTTGEVDASAPRSAGFDWMCAGCLLPMSGDRPVLLVVEVSVDAGATPVWDVSADLGS